MANATNATNINAQGGFYQILFIALYAVLILFISFGNTLVITAVSKFEKLRTISNVYVTGLAICDLTIGSVVLPLRCITLIIELTSEESLTTYVLARVSYVLGRVLLYTSISVLALAAVERRYAITQPFQHIRMFTVRRAILSVFVSFLVSLLLEVIPDVATRRAPSLVRNETFTLSSFYVGVYEDVKVQIIIQTLTIVAVCYTRIATVAHKQQRAIADQVSRFENNGVTLNNNAKIAKMLFVMLGVVYLCWVPYICLTYFIKDDVDPLGYPTENKDYSLFIIFSLLRDMFLYLSSMVNPLIYAGMNKDFRNAFSKLLRESAK